MNHLWDLSNTQKALWNGGAGRLEIGKIQGDHGPGAGPSWQNRDAVDLRSG
jgi:hypothetical protein